MLRSLGIAGCATAVAPFASMAAEPEPPQYSFRRVVDLTHTLSPTFPTPWKDPLALEQISKLGTEKWNIFRWHLNEHIGTHLDAPLHCTDLDSADRIPVESLVGPLVIVDIRERAAADPDSQLTLADLRSWERKHGLIPDGAVVAMCSRLARSKQVGPGKRGQPRSTPAQKRDHRGWQSQDRRLHWRSQSGAGVAVSPWRLNARVRGKFKDFMTQADLRAMRAAGTPKTRR